MFPPHSEFTSGAFQVRNYSSLAALIFLFLEYFSNCRSEYNYIWRARLTPVKYIYLTSRYVGLIGQIVHYALVHVFLAEAPVKPELCKYWYLFLFGTCAVMLAALDAILLLRVYALYSKNVKVHILSLPVILQFIIGSIQMEQVTRSHQFNSYCDKPSSLKNAGLAGGSVLLAHVAIWVAIFANRNVAQGVVVRLVVRESAWVLFILISIITSQTAYAVVSDSSNPFVFFVWPIAIMSVITCRITLNMYELETEVPQRGGFNSSESCLSTVELRSSSDRNEV